MQVLIQNYPHMLLAFHKLSNYLFHIDKFAIFEAKTLCQSCLGAVLGWIVGLVPVQSHIREPFDSLSALTAENRINLVPNVDVDMNSLHLYPTFKFHKYSVDMVDSKLFEANKSEFTRIHRDTKN